MIDGMELLHNIFVAIFFRPLNIRIEVFGGFELNKIIYHFSTSLVPHNFDDNNIDEQICLDTPTHRAQPDTNHLNFGSLLSDFYLLQNYFYIFWSDSYRVFTGKYLDQQKVSIISSKVLESKAGSSDKNV